MDSMEVSNSKEISELIYSRINSQKSKLIEEYKVSKGQIGNFYIDDILPIELAKKCFEYFPDKAEMRCLKSMRE